MGFFDVAFMVDAPETATDMCFALRMIDIDGFEVLALPEICASKYGNGAGGNVPHVVPCMAEPWRDQYILTWWVKAPTSSDGAAWTHPCLIPNDAPENISEWPGGCAVMERYVRDGDTLTTLGSDN